MSPSGLKGPARMTGQISMDKASNVQNRHWLTLLEQILSDLPGWACLIDDDRRVVVAPCAKGQADRDWLGPAGRLGMVQGPEVSIDLDGMAAECLQRKSAVVLENVAVGSAGTLRRIDVRITPAPMGSATWAFVYLAERLDQAELAVQQTREQSLASLTGLAARIAHEVNNPLDGSMRYISLALRRLEQTPDDGTAKIEEYLGSAQDALGKIQQILSDLAKFARSGQSSIGNISVNELVEQAVKTMLLRAESRRIQIVTALSDRLPEAGGPRLYQVFCNLIKNAIDAIDERRRRDPDCPSIINIRTSVEGGCVRVSVEDTGCGLPENPQRIFEPFYSTKGDRGGAGLGLAIAREIVEEQGGSLSAGPGRDAGAKFVVELPAATPALQRERMSR